ncbi:uncharacterized protein LOC141699711 [Apium graveolens]|uniref:uncharacterized protein LOC141699711 n=1 Tax=Apium graveolens TaxID=4045 RepID=UPI003D7B76A4
MLSVYFLEVVKLFAGMMSRNIHPIMVISWKFYIGIVNDVACDSSVNEQMPFVLRYVDMFGEVLEYFIGVTHVSDTSTISLKLAVENVLTKHGLSISKVRGQGYDGALNMREELNGMKTLILKEIPSAGYVHYFSHQLQLVVVSVAKEIQFMGQFFDYVSMIVNMVGASFKRNDALRQKQQDHIVQNLEKSEKTTGTRMYQEISLARPGETRWGSYYKTIIPILAMWSTVLEVLGDVDNDCSMLLHLDELYPDDFSSSDMMQLNEQLKVYIIELRRKKHFPNLDGIGVLAKKMAELDFHRAFHLVYRLMELALVLPVATTSVDRTFLAMKIIKTDLRNKIDDDFLNDCMVCYIKKEIFLQADNEVILDHFEKIKTRRNLLPEKKIVALFMNIVKFNFY